VKFKEVFLYYTYACDDVKPATGIVGTSISSVVL